MTVHIQDVKGQTVNEEWRWYYLSLSKLVGKKIVDIEFTINMEGPEPLIEVRRVIFDDNSMMWFQGEHDMPYLVHYTSDFTQPNTDEETLRRLRLEYEAEE
jgi:hypothetical protein